MLICTIYSAFAFGVFLADEYLIQTMGYVLAIGIFNMLAFLGLISTTAGNGIMPEKCDS